jgi:hypothetical protein
MLTKYNLQQTLDDEAEELIDFAPKSTIRPKAFLVQIYIPKAFACERSLRACNCRSAIFSHTRAAAHSNCTHKKRAARRAADVLKRKRAL